MKTDKYNDIDCFDNPKSAFTSNTSFTNPSRPSVTKQDEPSVDIPIDISWVNTFNYFNPNAISLNLSVCNIPHIEINKW